MMCRILFVIFGMMWLGSGFAAEEMNVKIDHLVKAFDQNPANPQTTILLLRELKKEGKSGQEVLERYFKTQRESDYCKEYNWIIVRDFVHDFQAPPLRYVFENSDQFIQYYPKEDVYQKLDDVLVKYLEPYYNQDQSQYEQCLNKLKEQGYEHISIVADYFEIRKLRADQNAEEYFYKARKLFRYFPENRAMIKEITAGALEIMKDVSRLKVIQLWAGKTVESKTDFDALYNYVKISQKCGYKEIASKYASIANRLALASGNQLQKQKARELIQMLN